MKRITEYIPGKFYFYVGRIGNSAMITLFLYHADGRRQYFIDRFETSYTDLIKDSWWHFELNEDEIMNHVILENI